MKHKGLKIVYGICGIGSGHFYRQLPVINYLIANKAKIMFFAYGQSLKLLKEKFGKYPNVRVVCVCVPFYKGDANGLNFTQTRELNSGFDFHTNFMAFEEAQGWIGKPDVVISDYEPFSAQYAYAYGTKVITIDQQSKFLTGNTPDIAGYSCKDEIMRLNMFFPKATRLACSFFDVVSNRDDVIITRPEYRPELLFIKRNEKTIIKNFSIVYISQQTSVETINEIENILKTRSESYLVINQVLKSKYTINDSSHKLYELSFEKALESCEGVICTAGHSLLSECVYLNIPVLAIPLPLYEQQLNALMIEKNGWGLCCTDFNDNSIDRLKELQAIGMESSSGLVRSARAGFTEYMEKPTLLSVLDRELMDRI